jgi:hypothetical protein
LVFLSLFLFLRKTETVHGILSSHASLLVTLFFFLLLAPRLPHIGLFALLRDLRVPRRPALVAVAVLHTRQGGEGRRAPGLAEV